MFWIVNIEVNGFLRSSFHDTIGSYFSLLARSFLFFFVSFLVRQNLKMLLAVKAIDCQRGIWGLSSMRDGDSVFMLKTCMFFSVQSGVFTNSCVL